MPKNKIQEPDSFIELGVMELQIAANLESMADDLELAIVAADKDMLNITTEKHTEFARFKNGPHRLRMEANRVRNDHAGASRLAEKRGIVIEYGKAFFSRCKTMGLVVSRTFGPGR